MKTVDQVITEICQSADTTCTYTPTERTSTTKGKIMGSRNVEYVTRWVVTHINQDGERVISSPASQGRYTYETEHEARFMAGAMVANNHPDKLVSVFGDQCLGTFEARPCKCYANGFDPAHNREPFEV